jgi:hypothetical protein
MEQVKRLLGVSGAFAFCLSLGCSGSIQDPNGGSPAAGAPGSANGGSAAGSAPSGNGGSGNGSGNSNGNGGSGVSAGGSTNAGATGTTGGGSSAGGSTVGGSGNGGIPTVLTPPANPGFVIARRLNHREYNNTVRDLLGTTLSPANDFPADDLGSDFDTVGSALSLSPAYVAAYEKAAQALTVELFAADATRKGKVLTCNVETGGDTCAQTVLSAFVRRAWRRPIAPEELQALMTPVAKAKELGLTASEGLRSALTAVLMSPFFLFRLEIDPEPNSKAVRRLTPPELAARLSYALWSTMPDDTLNQAVDGGQLTTDEQVAAQVDRMLGDPRADTLLDGFAGHWLDYSAVDSHEIDAAKFPKFTPALAQAMETEASRFVQDFLRGTRPVSEMMTARFTFVNSALSTHYGLSVTGASATQFVRADTANSQRVGLLTLGALLTTTSYAGRTSPVRRGEFVFSRLLCETVPPPPPDVPTLSEASTAATMRQRLEQHRADPACSGCHTLMDPIGFGLETYDAIGVYRAQEAGAAIDASGTLPDGRKFNGAIELGNLLASDGRFPVCVTRKFMTFAIGRLLNQADDTSWVSYLAGRSQAAGGSLPASIRAVLLSDTFRARQQQPL